MVLLVVAYGEAEDEAESLGSIAAIGFSGRHSRWSLEIPAAPALHTSGAKGEPESMTAHRSLEAINRLLVIKRRASSLHRRSSCKLPVATRVVA